MSSPVSGYCRELAAYAESIEDGAISQSDRGNGVRLAAAYYRHIASLGVHYGEAAVDILRNQGLFGEVANALLRAGIEATHLHWDWTEVQNERDNVVILLAARDSRLRRDRLNLPTTDIATYHYEIFEQRRIPREYWGGSFFEEHIASGSYMAWYTGTKNILSLHIVMNVARNVVLDRKYNGVSARTAMRNLLRLFSVRKDTGLRMSAECYRTASA